MEVPGVTVSQHVASPPFLVSSTKTTERHTSSPAPSAHTAHMGHAQVCSCFSHSNQQAAHCSYRRCRLWLRAPAESLDSPLLLSFNAGSRTGLVLNYGTLPFPSPTFPTNPSVGLRPTNCALDSKVSDMESKARLKQMWRKDKACL